MTNKPIPRRKLKELKQLSKEEGKKKPEKDFIRAKIIKPRDIEWLWRNWIARRKLHNNAGESGIYKSSVFYTLAAIVSDGMEWPDGTEAKKGKVCIFAGEDDWQDTVIPRLIAANANLNNIRLIKSLKSAFIDRNIKKLKDCDLFIIDPLGMISDGKNASYEARLKELDPYVKLCKEYNFALETTTHLRKNNTNENPLIKPQDKILGTVANVTHPRIVSMFLEIDDRYVFSQAVNNIAPKQNGFEYHMELVKVKGVREKQVKIIFDNELDQNLIQIHYDMVSDQVDKTKQEECIYNIRSEILKLPKLSMECNKFRKLVCNVSGCEERVFYNALNKIRKDRKLDYSIKTEKNYYKYVKKIW